MSIEVMKQALDAITNVLAGNDFDNPYADLKQAGAALRQAIKQEEKREWVGLTDEEKRQILLDDPIDWINAIEAKLKEKNT